MNDRDCEKCKHHTEKGCDSWDCNFERRMTRKEAIAIIRKEYLCVDRDCDIDRSCGKCDLMMPTKEPILEAFKMAMNSLEIDERYELEYEQAEPCEDAISRQAVIKNQKIVYQEYCKTDNEKALMEELARLNNELPPVNSQEPKTGHWIGHREHCENLGVIPSGLGAYEWCSNCDCGIDVREWHRNNYNYCPNCGAKMAESEGKHG